MVEKAHAGPSLRLRLGSTLTRTSSLPVPRAACAGCGLRRRARFRRVVTASMRLIDLSGACRSATVNAIDIERPSLWVAGTRSIVVTIGGSSPVSMVFW